jgi:prepilin-type N-terminal cleavage/methylation domain
MNTMRVQRRLVAGFTLIELMIVVAIVAILLAIALPSYTDYVTRGKLTEAQNTLSAYRVSMEQYYQDNRSYLAAGGGCGVDPAPVSSTLKYFALGCTPAASGSTYVADATGNAGSPVSGFTFEINNANVRSTPAAPAGWGAPSVAGCWVVRKGGGCQ